MKIKCPEGCSYRQKDAPVCGFCLMKILELLPQEEKKEGEEDGQTRENQGAGETD